MSWTNAEERLLQWATEKQCERMIPDGESYWEKATDTPTIQEYNPDSFADVKEYVQNCTGEDAAALIITVAAMKNKEQMYTEDGRANVQKKTNSDIPEYVYVF